MTEPTNATATDGADPSMEEILASIRRILNEDEAGPPPEPDVTATSQPAAEAAEDVEEDDVLVLDRSMLVSAPQEEPDPAPPPAPIAEAPPVPEPQFTEPPPAPVPVPVPVPVGQTSLLAPEAAAAAASSVDGLLRTLAASRSTHVYRGGPTLEDLVREEIRPLLKDWLDSHLPPLVERLVRAEIERVVGRAVS